MIAVLRRQRWLLLILALLAGTGAGLVALAGASHERRSAAAERESGPESNADVMKFNEYSSLRQGSDTPKEFARSIASRAESQSHRSMTPSSSI